MKTLVPQVHGGILGRRDDAAHLAQMAQHAIAPIDLVAVNLYPFEATVAKGAPFEDCIENIDIGGPAMIRSAAKNHAHVVVVTEPAHLARITAEIEASGGTSHALRRELAAAAYARTAAYDAAISTWFAGQIGQDFRRAWLSPASSRRRCAMARTRTRRRASTSMAAIASASRRPSRCRARSSLQQPERHRRRL